MHINAHSGEETSGGPNRPSSGDQQEEEGQMLPAFTDMPTGANGAGTAVQTAPLGQRQQHIMEEHHKANPFSSEISVLPYIRR